MILSSKSIAYCTNIGCIKGYLGSKMHKKYLQLHENYQLTCEGLCTVRQKMSVVW